MSENPAGLNQAAMQALGAGDFATAQALLQRLVAADPASIPGWLNLAAVRRRLNDVDGAFDALREVMRRDPRNFPALLMSATLMERQGDIKGAAGLYGAALSNAPPDNYLDRPTQQAVAHAREVHGRHTREMSDFIRARIGDTQSQCAPIERRRVDSFIDMTLRVRKRYQQEPLEYFYPGLPAIEFYEREEFPWLADLEAATVPMQQELATILREDQAGFAPYIHYEDHMPLDQWRELNHSPRWSAFHFYEKGQPVAERCRRAPATMEVLARLPQAQVPLRSPSALFSVLQPKTRIPPHTGVANFRLVVHLPLIVPPACGFRVGGETRQWRIGEAWVFDDTIEHEAWNDSEQTRIIFICDVWSPRLSPDERAVIGEIIAATDAFNGTQPTSSV
jgi:aspartyl/asparaginyl beta-hydroxylase (cupin superfamily)